MAGASLLAGLALAGCAGGQASLTCEVLPSPGGAPSLSVSWQTEDPATGLVRYGTDGGLDEQTASVQATDHRHLLYGLPPEAEITWQAVATVDGQERTCQGSTWTEALPGGVPVPTVELGEGGEADGVWLAAVYELGTYASWILAFDRQGTVRWFHQGDDERFIVDVQPALDGAGLLHNQFHNRFSEDVGRIRRLSWDGTVQEEVETRLAHHMFAQLPDGGLAWQTLDPRPWTDPESGEVLDLVGDAVVERDPQGVVTEVWNAWDWLDVQPNQFSSLLSIYPQGIDWTHGNALKYDQAADAWLVSLGNAGTVLTVDRASGQPTDIVGAYGAGVVDGSPALEHQHDPTWLDADTLLVFDSHFDDLVSGAFEYRRVGDQLELTWHHLPEDPRFAVVLGQAWRNDDGGTGINFGSAGVIEELDARGSPTWRLRIEEGFGFGQVRWLPDFPTP